MYKGRYSCMNDVGSETTEKLPGPPFTIYYLPFTPIWSSCPLRYKQSFSPVRQNDKVLGFGLGCKSLEKMLPLSALIMDFLSKPSL